MFWEVPGWGQISLIKITKGQKFEESKKNKENALWGIQTKGNIGVPIHLFL